MSGTGVRGRVRGARPGWAPLAVAPLVALLLGVAGLLAGPLAGPASAHGRGSDATNVASLLRAAPDVPGVAWRVGPGGDWLEVVNTSPVELVVLGDAGEPYLRVGPGGVHENVASPAAARDRDAGGTTPAARSDPFAAPEWVRVGDGPRHAWRDHRVRWTGPAPPPVADPAAATPVGEWTVPFAVGGDTHAVTGELRWVPGGSPWPWLLGALVATLPALAGLVPGRSARGARLARPAAVVLGLVTAANAAHLVDQVRAVGAPPATGLLAAGQTLLFLAIAGFAAVRGWQGRDGAFTALGVGAGALLAGQGLLYLPALSASQNASLLPLGLFRAVAALSVAQALPVLAVAVVGARRSSRRPPTRAGALAT